MELASSRTRSNLDENAERQIRSIVTESVDKLWKKKQERTEDNNEERILKLISNMKKDVCASPCFLIVKCLIFSFRLS
jgi:hypothetical protein